MTSVRTLILACILFFTPILMGGMACSAHDPRINGAEPITLDGFLEVQEGLSTYGGWAAGVIGPSSCDALDFFRVEGFTRDLLEETCEHAWEACVVGLTRGEAIGLIRRAVARAPAEVYLDLSVCGDVPPAASAAEVLEKVRMALQAVDAFLTSRPPTCERSNASEGLGAAVDLVGDVEAALERGGRVLVHVPAPTYTPCAAEDADTDGGV